MADANKTLITLDNLDTFTAEVKSLISSSGGGFKSVDEYAIDVSTSGVYQTTIPNYKTTDFVEVFLNGLKMTPSKEFTVSSSGLLKTVNTVNSGGELVITVYRS